MCTKNICLMGSVVGEISCGQINTRVYAYTHRHKQPNTWSPPGVSWLSKVQTIWWPSPWVTHSHCSQHLLTVSHTNKPRHVFTVCHLRTLRHLSWTHILIIRWREDNEGLTVSPPLSWAWMGWRICKVLVVLLGSHYISSLSWIKRHNANWGMCTSLFQILAQQQNTLIRISYLLRWYKCI